MEELQGTEKLCREILEDARKKAQKILKTADETIKQNSAEWEKKTAAVLAELNSKYGQESKIYTEKIMAFLPTDKQREKVKKTEEFLKDAVNTWSSGLNRRQIRDILQKKLANRIKKCDVSGPIQAYFQKIDPKDAKLILKAVLPGKSIKLKEIHSDSAYPEIIIDFKKARVIGSIGKTVDFFLDNKREELVEALLGSSKEIAC